MHSLGIVQWNSTRRDHPGNPEGVSGSGLVIIDPDLWEKWQFIGTHQKQKRFMKRTPRTECRRQQTGLDLQLTLEALLLIMTMGDDL